MNFNVGPSVLSDATKKDVKRALNLGISEISHRSEEFSEISQNAIEGLYKYFSVPSAYKIFYTSSATEAIQLSLANCCEKTSFHFVCGSFSQLFSDISARLGKRVFKDEVNPGLINNYNASISEVCDFISVTQNETSTGAMCPLKYIKTIHSKYPEKILAVDITSSAGATDIDISRGDIWLFSVQKCFGLPAGLGIIIISPRAFHKSIRLSEKKKNLAGYFTFENMWKKMDGQFQTLQTPNVLAIYLLSKRLEFWNKNGGLGQNISLTDDKFNLLNAYIKESKNINYLISEPEFRSKTIFCLESSVGYINKLHGISRKKGVILGKGYGSLKETTIRIANFPNIKKKDIKALKKLLQ